MFPAPPPEGLKRSHNCIGLPLCGVCNPHSNDNLLSCDDSNCFFTIGTTGNTKKKSKKKGNKSKRQ